MSNEPETDPAYLKKIKAAVEAWAGGGFGETAEERKAFLAALMQEPRKAHIVPSWDKTWFTPVDTATDESLSAGHTTAAEAATEAIKRGYVVDPPEPEKDTPDHTQAEIEDDDASHAAWKRDNSR